MQASVNPPAGRSNESLDQRQIAGIWVLGGAILMLIGASMPHLCTISDEVAGFDIELNVGIFGMERCTAFGCQEIPMDALLVQSSWIPRLVSTTWQVLAVAAIIVSAAAGVMALMGKRVRGSWVEVPVGVLLVLVLLVVLGWEIQVVHYLAGLVGFPQMGLDSLLFMPGLSLVALIIGTITVLKFRKQLEA